MDLVVLLLLTIIGILILAGIFLLHHLLKIHKVLNIFMEKGNLQDARELLFSHIEKTKELEIALAQAFDDIEALEHIAKVSFQKTGVIRFNPFKDMGGNQSFAIALLDSQNNGFVISSLLGAEGNRMYAKPVAQGKSDYTLSTEEKEAISRAMRTEIQNPKS